ncbi:hypothetical protein K438DRAFT_2000215 [Mycena galopus ATCC 62051]|nr:hypothetical protein K438DRAFT_2000215 [Mycena galopus ATCC 62051]
MSRSDDVIPSSFSPKIGLAYKTKWRWASCPLNLLPWRNRFYYAALEAGKFPSTEQLNALIDWLSHSVIPAVQPSEDSLSGQGRLLATDIRKILDGHKSLNLNKNHDNLLQDAIWHLNEGEIDTAIYPSLRTIISIVWQSISSEGSFLFSDFASFARLALADAAEAVQDQAGRAKESLREVEQGVQDGQRDDLGRDKQRLEEEEDVRVAFEHGMDTLKETGSGVIGAGQKAKETTEDISERTTARLQAAYYKACERAQTDPAYRSSLSTLFDTLHKWVSKAFDTALDQSFTLDTIIEDASPEQHIHKALNELKILADRFAQPKSSVDDVLLKAQRFALPCMVIRLEDPEYPRSQEARAVRRDLRKRARTLLDANTDAGRTWTELKETAQTFGRQDVERGLVEAGEQAETGVQAVLERAAWFWRDLFAVYAPRALSMLKDIPIPRTDSHFVRNVTDVDVRTSETAPATTGVGTFTHIRLQAVQLALEDVSFYYKDKTATMPPSEFTGILALKMPDRAARRAYHHIELLTVQIADDVDLDPIFNMRFREALGRSLGEQLRIGMDWMDHVAWDVGQRAEVFSDAGVGRGASFAAAVWSEIGRLSRERTSAWRATGTGVVLEERTQGGATFAMGAEPQILSGEKRGPMGTASESLDQRVGQAVQAVQGQTGTPEDVSKVANQGVQDVQKHLQGAVRKGKRQINSFQRSVDEKSAMERKNPGWKSQAFDV